VVGVVTALLVELVDTVLGNPLGEWIGIVSVVTGITAGAFYGLHQRRLHARLVALDTGRETATSLE